MTPTEWLQSIIEDHRYAKDDRLVANRVLHELARIETLEARLAIVDDAYKTLKGSLYDTSVRDATLMLFGQKAVAALESIAKSLEKPSGIRDIDQLACNDGTSQPLPQTWRCGRCGGLSLIGQTHICPQKWETQP